MSPKIATVTILTTIILFLSCAKSLGQREYLEIEKLPESERLSKFSSYPVEKQIDIYLFSKLYTEGGSGTYGRYLASNGTNKLPNIVKRLDESNDLLVKIELIHTIELINGHCLCVAGNADILRILEKNDIQINTEDDPSTRKLKEVYSDYLQRIKSIR